MRDSSGDENILYIDYPNILFLVVILHYSFAVLQDNTTGVNKVKSVRDHSVLFLKIAQ